MNPDQEKLLEDFEEFELDLEVEAILAKVKKDWVPDQGVSEFAEKLKQREEEKRAAQIQRETQVQQEWTPGHYPQLTCDWFVEGLDFCCPYWRYQFTATHTPATMSDSEEEAKEELARRRARDAAQQAKYRERTGKKFWRPRNDTGKPIGTKRTPIDGDIGRPIETNKMR